MNDKIKKQIVALLQAAQSGDQQATQALQQIMTKAKQGDQKAIALAKAIQTVMKEMQGQASAQPQNPVAAKFGAKLNYIKTLKGDAPEGQEVVYYKEGGQVKKKFVPKNCKGRKTGREEIQNFKKKACSGIKMRQKGQSGLKFGGSNKSNRFAQQSNVLPEVVVNSSRPYRFNRRQTTVGPGYSITSDALFSEYNNGEYMGDLSEIKAGRTIYHTPFGNDTIYGGAEDFMKDTSPYNWIDYSSGFMPIVRERTNQGQNKRNFYRTMRQTYVAPRSDQDTKSAFNRARRGY